MAFKVVAICDRNRKVAVSNNETLPVGWEKVKNWVLCPECVIELNAWFNAGQKVTTTVEVSTTGVTIK